MLGFEDFARLIIEAQSVNSEASYNSWTILSNFSKENFETFLTYFIKTLESSDSPLNSKKISIILFDYLFKIEDHNYVIIPEIFPSLIEVILSMFQLNDIELSGLSGKLISSLVLPELLDDYDSEMMTVFAKSFLGVHTDSEIYGISTVLYDLCRNTSVSRTEQQLIMQGIHLHLIENGNEVSTFNKIAILKILETQIDSSLEEQALQIVLQMLVELLSNSELHNDIFYCFYLILLNFPNYIQFIFQNVVSIAIQSLIQNENNQQSIIYFFNNLISDDTIQFYQKIIPIILPPLFKIFQSEVDNFQSDTSRLIENILEIYKGNIIQLIDSLPNKTNLSFLLSFCVIAKNQKEGEEVNFPFLISMINSVNERERYMAIRCVKKLVKNDTFSELAVSESLKHLEDEVSEVRYEVIGLLGHLSKNQNFPIENYFESLLNFYLSENPYLSLVSYSALRRVIKVTTHERLLLLTQPILALFEQFLNSPNFYENLISLSTLIQTISFNLGEKFSPFAEHSLSLLQKMSNIDLDFMIHTFTAISSIASQTHILPFLDQFCQSMLTTLQSFVVDYGKKTEEELNDEDYIELVETTVDAVINSICFVMESFDITSFLPDFLTTYLVMFQMTHYNKFISGFNDIFMKYPSFVENVGEGLSQLLVASSSEFVEFVDENDCEDKNELFLSVTFLTDLISLLRIIVRCLAVDQPFFVFVLEMIVLCQKFVNSYKELKNVLLELLCELTKKLPNETFAFIQSHEDVKSVILFGLNDIEVHDYSQSIVDTFGAESF